MSDTRVPFALAGYLVGLLAASLMVALTRGAAVWR